MVKYSDRGQTEILDDKIDLHDIIIALTLLSRASYEEKLRLVFKLTDVDEDGCLSPEEIYKMIEVIERIFISETTNISIGSKVLLEQLSRERAMRRYEWAMRSVGNLESKCMKEDGLITFDEFNEVLLKMPQLRSQLLPKYINMKAVLKNIIQEPVYEISEGMRDEFLMFRYEMQALLSQNLQQPKRETREELDMGKSKMKPPEYSHKESPGLVKTKDNSESVLPPGVWEYNSSSSKVYVRDSSARDKLSVKQEERSKAAERIIPERPVEKALKALKEKHQQEQYVDEDETASFEALIAKVGNYVKEVNEKRKTFKDISVLRYK